MDSEIVKELEPLSYFFGAWLGDGHLGVSLKEKGYRYRPGIECSDKEIVTRCYLTIRANISDLPNAVITEHEIASGLTMYRVAWESRAFVDFLCMATNYRQQLPEYIWHASRESQLEMLAGLMDTDGGISRFKNQNPIGYAYILQFSGTKKFADEVPELFQRVGIKTGAISPMKGTKPNYKDSTRFNISLKSAAKKGFYFRCNRKMERFKDYVHTFTGYKVYDAPDDGMN